MVVELERLKSVIPALRPRWKAVASCRHTIVSLGAWARLSSSKGGARVASTSPSRKSSIRERPTTDEFPFPLPIFKSRKTQAHSILAIGGDLAMLQMLGLQRCRRDPRHGRGWLSWPLAPRGRCAWRTATRGQVRDGPRGGGGAAAREGPHRGRLRLRLRAPGQELHPQPGNIRDAASER